jgi:hypothetical protein
MSKIINHLRKEAGFGNLADAAGENLVGLIPYLIGVPLAGGAAVGYLASKMSSPTSSDKDAMQQQVMDTKVREELGVQQRKLEALKAKLKAKRDQPNISRRRDMFA